MLTLARHVCTGQGGDSFGRTGRSQQQLVTLQAINGNQVTIAPGLYMPNWRTSQNPGVSWANANMSGDGIENQDTAKKDGLRHGDLLG